MKAKKGYTLVELLVVIAIIIILLEAFIPTGIFVSKKVAIRALEDAGYSDVRITHKAIFFISFRGGDSRDRARFTAKAKNPAGEEVETYVFSGWLFKAPTIRAKKR